MKSFPIVVGTDGSGPARAAVAAAIAFPWPAGAEAHGVIARHEVNAASGGSAPPEATRDALETVSEQIRKDAESALARRWPAAKVELADRPPVEAILEVADRVGARAIVLGSRGYGPLRRFFVGSVSRGVVREARCPVLVVKGTQPPGGRLVLGLDGSTHAQRAVEFLAALAVPYDGRITVLRVTEPVRVPAMAGVPASVRAAIRGQAEALTAEAVEAARQDVETAAERLRQARWRVSAAVRPGVPVEELLRATRTRADCLVVGARGVGGVERLLLGSVADGALSRAPVSVLVVR